MTITIEAAAARTIVDGLRAGKRLQDAMHRAAEVFPNLRRDVLVDILKQDDEVRRAIIVEAAEDCWNEPPEPHPTLAIGGEPVQTFFDFPDPDVPGERRRVLAEHATFRHWREDALLALRDGAEPRGEEQLGKLKKALERAGGDLNARIIDHVDDGSQSL